MAAAPLESSSTPPRDTSTEPTRPQIDSMEDTDPQSTRKRPRLDSGSAACESLAGDKTSVLRMSDQSDTASAVLGQEAPASRPPANRMAINMKSLGSAEMALDSGDASPDIPGTAPPAQSPDVDANNASTGLSRLSSPTQSPEIEVAEVEDMDQDPSSSNWKPLGEALRDHASAEVVQLDDQLPLADTFPKFRRHRDLRENLEEAAAMIQKGPDPFDMKIFLDVKSWLDNVVNNLDQLTHETFSDDRDFWEEIPGLMESLLRRSSDFQPDEGEGPWVCFEEFCLSYARIALHLVELDTLTMKHLLERPEIHSIDLKSKAYLPVLGWMCQISGIPFYQFMQKLYGSDVADMVARISDHITAPPLDAVRRFSEYSHCAMALSARSTVFPETLAAVLQFLTFLVDSGGERRRHGADESVIDTPVYMRTLKTIYELLRDLDEKYQVHISKKSSWVGSDTSDALLCHMSSLYRAICLHDPSFALQNVAKDLSIEVSQAATPDDCAVIIYYGWRFHVLKKQIMGGRMELRVNGIETMQSDLINVWRKYVQGNPPGIMHPVVSYLVSFLREHKIVDYILGIDSHPQLISRSYNIVGFLIVTSTYTDLDTDTIWKTVIESQDSRTVAEVLVMFKKTFHMHHLEALLYLCSKLLDLPLDRFDARMIEYCDKLFLATREKHAERNRLAQWDILHVDAIPVRLCVRLIRESSAAEDLPVEHKTHLQGFASAQLSQLINVGLSETDKMETYERCIQDIAEMNQFTVGSLQALYALLPGREPQEIRKLATEFDLTRLVINEISHTLEADQNDFSDSFSRTGFLSRVNILARIIDHVPDTITEELADILWKKVFTLKGLVNFTRQSLWEMLCGVTMHSATRNPFVDYCIEVCLPQLSPEDYSPELLSFVKQTIGYQIRFDPPPLAAENEVISIPGMDRVWNLILTAPPSSIEAAATKYAIEVYLDHNLINRSPRSAVEATHISLVDRCVDQLQSAAARLKSDNGNTAPGQDDPMITVASDDAVQNEELRFGRSLLFLRQLLHGLRTRPHYSPPQGPPPDLPGRPVKGEMISIPYQAFHGGASSQVRSLRIGDLSTASELADRLVRLTGFTKFSTIYGGHKIDLFENPNATLRDLKMRAGLLIVRKDADSRDALAGRRQSLTLVDSEVLKHFDNLYDLLFLEDHLAREIYEFLVVFPPQERALQLVKSEDKTEDDMFPIEKPYSFLYSVNALSACLREEVLEASPNQSFISHSIHVLIAALTRPEMSESIEDNATKLLFASSLVECLLTALLAMPPFSSSSPVISNPPPLVERLLSFLEMGRHLPATHLSEMGVQKLISNSFAVLLDAAVRDRQFWTTLKQHAQLDKLLVSLLLEEKRQGVRKEISEIIVIACSPSQLTRNPAKSSIDDEVQKPSAVPENTLQVDILTTVWNAFVQVLPRTADYAPQSQEFFQVALLVFHIMGEKSPDDLRFGEYLKQWGGIMLGHRSEEFVGREPVDHLILGFSRLIKACLDLADTTNTPVDTFDLAEKLFDNYLFPDFSDHSPQPIVPQVPVMHGQTRQELYNVLSLLCKRNSTYLKMVERLEDIISEDQSMFTPNWCVDRSKLIRSPEGYAGLKNLSNTCYMNSLLTQLFMNVGFRDFMLHVQVADPESSQRLLAETKKVFGKMQETWLKSVDPQDLVDTIRTYDNEPIDVTIQMDVDEFYNLLFDRWEAQILDPEEKKKFRSFYGGQLVQQIKSKECSHISERLEPFSAIQCDIKGKATLEESLQAYVEGEIMQGDNKYSCTSCGRHVDAVKRACLKDVPDNLIFHLKRFDFDMVTMMRNKINDEFQFPEHIDMSPFKVEYLSDQDTAVESDVFQLVGVLVHSGTAESGHYYSYIRERPTADSKGSWVEFNDSDVSRFDPSKIADQCFGGYNEPHHSSGLGPLRFNKLWNAYMLFYQRVSSMESAKSVYKPAMNDIPVHVTLPVAHGNHIAMQNELFIRTYCLFDPCYTAFVRQLLCRLDDVMESERKENSMLDRYVLFIALDALEQLVSRSKDPTGSDGLINELLRAVGDVSTGAYRVIQWVESRPAGIRNLIVRSQLGNVREGAIRIIVTALAKLHRLQNSGDLDDPERMKWNSRYSQGFDNVVGALDDLWPVLQTVSRPWDDYFDFLTLLSAFGVYEVGVLLDGGFLQKCLEIVWLDREDSKKLKRQYIPYCRLLDKGRKFSHKKLMDFLYALLTYIDLSADPIPNGEPRKPLENSRFPLSRWEDSLTRSLGRNGELLLLKKILQQYSNPPACRNIVSFLLDAQSDADLAEPISKALEEGLRVDPAVLCAPFLEATLIFCRRNPDEDLILSLIDFVAKGVDSINNSGGAEHLAFFTNIVAVTNERAGLDEAWFFSQAVEKIPDWAPPLLLYPDKAVRNMTLEVLRQILLTKDPLHTEIAKELVQACVDRLKRVYLEGSRHNIESRVVEAINTVISHGLETYYGDNEDDQLFARYAQEILATIEDLTIELPEELASESDLPSPEEWEDNSIMASDSEMGMVGTP